MDRDRDRRFDRDRDRFSNRDPRDTFRSGRSPPPHRDGFRPRGPPPPTSDSYMPSNRAPRPRSRSPPSYRRRSRSPKEDRRDSYAPRGRSPPPPRRSSPSRRGYSPRRNITRGDDRRDPRDDERRFRSPVRDRERDRERERERDRDRERRFESPPMARGRDRSRSPLPPKRLRDASIERPRSPPPKRERLVSPPPRDRYRSPPPPRRSRSPPPSRFHNDRDRNRNRDVPYHLPEPHRRRSISPRHSAAGSGSTSRRSSPPSRPPRGRYGNDDNRPPSRGGPSEGRSPPYTSPSGQSGAIRARHSPRDADYTRVGGGGSTNGRTISPQPYRNGDGPGPSSASSGYHPQQQRPPPGGPRNFSSPGVGSGGTPPTGPAASYSSRGGYTNPILSAPSRPRGARGPPPTGPGGGTGAGAGGHPPGGVYYPTSIQYRRPTSEHTPERGSGAPPGGPAYVTGPRHIRGGMGPYAGRGGGMGMGMGGGGGGPPSHMGGMAFRGRGGNSSSTTYPRTQHFNSAGAPTSGRGGAGGGGDGGAGSLPPTAPAAASTSSAHHQSRTRGAAMSSYLSDVPAIVPGGKKRPPLDPVAESRIRQLEEGAERLRSVILEKEGSKRVAVREWARLEREAEKMREREGYVEEGLRRLNGEEGGGPAF